MQQPSAGTPSSNPPTNVRAAGSSDDVRHARELAELRLTQLKTQEAEAAAGRGWRKGVNWTVVLPLVAAIIAATASYLVGLHLERRHAQSLLWVERMRTSGELVIEVARADPANRASNLRWMLAAGLLYDPDGRIAALAETGTTLAISPAPGAAD